MSSVLSSGRKRSDRKLSEVARHLVIPDGIETTEWPIVSRELARMEWPMDGWQQGLCTVATGLRSNGQYAAGIGGVCLSICRQTGKTHTVGGLVFALCMAKPGTLVIWTAHRARTHNETFRDMAGKAETAAIRPHINHVRRSNGEQEIEFRNGSRILFGAREAGFGRGFKEVDIIVLDEAQILTLKAMEDMVPAANAAPNGLVLLMGTPPRPMDPGEVFSGIREAALSGDDTDVLYVELSADPDGKPMDRAQWEKANPSYPHRTTETAILRMRKLLGSLESFRREALGIWDEKSTGQKAFRAEVWNSRVDEPPVTGLVTFGVKFAPDGSQLALAGAVKFEDRIHVEALRSSPMSDGTQWYIDFLVQRREKVAQIVVDGRAGAGYFVNALRRAKVPARLIVTPTVEQAQTAYSTFDRGIVEGGATHSGQPELDEEATTAMRRKIGTAGGFGYDPATEGGSVALLEAAAFAYWAAKTTKRNPGRRQRLL